MIISRPSELEIDEIVSRLRDTSDTIPIQDRTDMLRTLLNGYTSTLLRSVHFPHIYRARRLSTDSLHSSTKDLWYIPSELSQLAPAVWL